MKKTIGIICLVLALAFLIMKLNIIITFLLALLGIVLLILKDNKQKEIKYKKYADWKHWLMVNWSLVGFILLIVVGIACGISNYNRDKNNPSKVNDWSFYACEYAKKEVKAELKAPSSAKFENCDTMKITNLGPNWTITGKVEAQNSFGVMLMNDFTVKLERIGQNKYNVISIDIK